MIIGDLDGTPIVAPLDGSAADLGVVTLSAAIAAQLHTELVLLRVVRPLLPPLFQRPLAPADRAALDARLIAQTDRAIRGAEAELREFERALDGARVSHLVLVSSRPARRLIDWLRSHRVGLVVISATPHRGVCRLSRNDVAACLLRASVAPVLRVTCTAASQRTGTLSRPLQRRRGRGRSATRG